MFDTVSETEACGLLARLFKSRGYAIKRNVTFREYGVEFHVDGWDPKARVGFEFLTSEDDDHDDLTLEEYKTLAAAQQRGELSLFILDEVEPLSEADLAEMANEFLDEVAAGKKPRRGAGTGKKTAAARRGRPVAASRAKRVKKAASKKPAGKKPAPGKKLRGTGASAKKAAAKKPAAAPAGRRAVAKKRPARR